MMQPRRRLGETWRGPLQLVAAVAITAVIAALVSLVVFGILQGRDDARHGRSRTDIRQLRETVVSLATEVSMLEEEVTTLQANQSDVDSLLQPIGFSASKDSNQAINTDATTAITDWDTEDGRPQYNATGGGFDGAAGVFTASVAAKYQVNAVTCWTPGGFNATTIASIVTNAGGGSIFGSNYDPGFGALCNTMAGVFDLNPGENVIVTVRQDSGDVKVVTTASTFSVERIAID